MSRFTDEPEERMNQFNQSPPHSPTYYETVIAQLENRISGGDVYISKQKQALAFDRAVIEKLENTIENKNAKIKELEDALEKPGQSGVMEIDLENIECIVWMKYISHGVWGPYKVFYDKEDLEESLEGRTLSETNKFVRFKAIEEIQ